MKLILIPILLLKMFTFVLDLQWNLFRYIVSIIETSFGNKIYVDLILLV